jgi:hypothetical protein
MLFRPRNSPRAMIERHFGAQRVDRLIAAGRTFPLTTRVDLQFALERQFSGRYPAELVGIHSDFVQDTLSIAHLVGGGQFQLPIIVGPLQHDEIDVGEAARRALRARVRVPDHVAQAIVQKTEKASPAFIKELMRRAAQYQLEAGGSDTLALPHVESALDEMLFAGGSLNVKLLGGAAS